MTECIPWDGRVNNEGYGTIGNKLAHRVEWAKANGPIPTGMTLDHQCHDPEVCKLGRQCPHRRCVRLDHIVLCTPEENRARSNAGGPQASKTHCPRDHEYTPDNTLISYGRRHCRTCRRALQAERRAKQKIETCRALGHERVDKVAENGNVCCAICLIRVSRMGTAAQYGPKVAA